MDAATETTTPDRQPGAAFGYRISGLSVVSEIELPGAVLAPADAGAAEVTVRLGRVPTALEGAAESGPNWELGDSSFLLRVPRLARLLIAEGRRIDIELEPGVSARSVGPYVLGTAFGILLHQRGAVALHSAAVARDGRAMAICGVSGAGKSTLAAALCQAGFEFVADDLCLVTLDAANRPSIAPDGRRLKLWQEAIERLDVGDRRGDRVVDDIAKFFVQPQTTAVEPPLLTAVYVLRDEKPPLQEGIEPLNLPDAMRMLDFQAYRPKLREKLTTPPAKLAQGARILSHARVFTLTRPRGFERLADTVANLRAHWEELAR